jgi:hypothetical protein
VTRLQICSRDVCNGCKGVASAHPVQRPPAFRPRTRTAHRLSLGRSFCRPTGVEVLRLPPYSLSPRGEGGDQECEQLPIVLAMAAAETP